MKEYVISIGAVILVTTVLTIIIPQGKIGKFVKGFFSIIITLVILSPLSNLSLDEFNLNDFNVNSKYQHDFLYYVAENKIASLEQDSQIILENSGIKNAEVDIDFIVNDDYSTSIKNVKINLKKAVIISNGQHINIIEEGVNYVSKYLSVDKGVIVVDGYN